jgi:ApaG protein
MYRAVTRNIIVDVEPRFLPERSEPAKGQFFWAYTITIVNQGIETVQLRYRHWKITDGHGQLQEVRGPGVIGEQPVLAPGERFTYTSGCPLETPQGIMVGSYEMVTDDGETFSVDIPAFSLDAPNLRRTLN